MELRDRKFILNTGKLPGFTDGVGNVDGDKLNQLLEKNRNSYFSLIFDDRLKLMTQQNSNGPTSADSAAAVAGPWFAIGSWLGGGVLEGLNSVKSSDQLIAEAGTAEGSIGGINYRKYNNVNVDNVMSDYKNSTAKDFLTNPARGITKLFMSDKQEMAAREAERLANNANINNRDVAYSDFLTNNFNLKKGNTLNLQLFQAKDGKPVFSSHGPVNASATAKVSNGETIVSPDGSAYVVPGTPNFKDGRFANVGMRDAVLSNHGASQYYLMTGDLNGALMMDKMYRNNKGVGYKNGKLPKFAGGWWYDTIPAAIGSLTSLDLIYQASKNKPYKPNVYSSNRYANNALNTLSGLRINPYQILPSIYNMYDRTASSIDRSGGLNASQMDASKIAAMSLTLNNIYNGLMQGLAQNNQYKTGWAQLAVNIGAQDAQRRMAADQYAEDYYAKSHAARLGGIQTGLYNLNNLAWQVAANRFKKDQFDDTMSLYRLLKKLDEDYIKYLISRG